MSSHQTFKIYINTVGYSPLSVIPEALVGALRECCDVRDFGVRLPLQSAPATNPGSHKPTALCNSKKQGSLLDALLPLAEAARYSALSGISHHGSVFPGNAALLETTESERLCVRLLRRTTFSSRSYFSSNAKSTPKGMLFTFGGSGEIRTRVPVKAN